MRKLTVDVAIIGNGPAGCTVALMLAKSGISVSLIGLSEYSNILFGETVHPNIKFLLYRLGLWKDFLNDEHLPSAGNLSAWGDGQVRENNFIFHPNSQGWHLDRWKFNLMLLNAAKKAGVLYFNSRIYSINRQLNNWFNIILESQDISIGNSIVADFIVDATGRASWYSRREGIQKYVFDSLCGNICFLTPRIEGDSDSMTLTESVPDGWWYSALLPKNVRAVSFFTDSNTTIARSAKSQTGWKALLHDTKYIKLNLEEYKYHVVSGPYTVMSNSSRLKKAIGEDWLAVGDAAATYDPISSMGITTAITDGINASNTIMKHLNGNGECIQQYNKNIIAAFNEYLKKRTYYYKLENRWPDSNFWKQNQKPRMSN